MVICMQMIFFVSRFFQFLFKLNSFSFSMKKMPCCDASYSSEHHRQLLVTHMRVYRDVAQRCLELNELDEYRTVSSIYPVIIRWYAAAYVRALREEYFCKQQAKGLQ